MASMEECQVVAEDCLEMSRKAYERAIDQGTQLGSLAAMFLARGGQALESVLVLAPRGLVGDAMSVTRTIVELEIDFLYIATDPDRLIPLFLDHDSYKVHQLVEAWEKHTGRRLEPERRQELNAGYARSLANKPDSDSYWNSWAGISIKKRAEMVGRNMSYAVVYADMCRASHSGYGTLTYAMPDEETVHFGRGRPHVRPVALAIASYYALAGRVGYACALRDLLPEFIALAPRIERL
jgi:hypothetical protein